MTIWVNHEATLPDNCLFVGQLAMSYTLSNIRINHYSDSNVAKIFGEINSLYLGGYYANIASENSEQTVLFVGSEDIIYLNGDNTITLKTIDSTSTNNLAKLDLLRLMYNSKSNSKGTLNVPSILYDICTEDDWQIMRDKGWTVNRIEN